MSESIVRLTARDFEETMDFLNLVFGAKQPHDFENLLPAVYQPTDAWMGYNHAIRSGGRIRAIVGLVPILWRVGDRTFKLGGIGAVSTHPKSRGAGYMKALMEHCVRLMKEEGYQLSELGGQRQRYRYFGYEICGQADCYRLNRANVRHCFYDDPGIRLVPISGEDRELLRRAQTLHDAQPLHCLRGSDNFYNYLRNWHSRPHAALDFSGRMVGYLTATAKGERLHELVAESDEAALRTLRAWTAGHTDSEVAIDLPAWRAGLGRLLGACCEGVAAQPSGNWRIFDWAGVIDALLGLRRLAGELAEGTVVLGIEGCGAFEIRAAGDRASCARTDAPPDVALDEPTAMRVLFGPLPPSRVAPLPSRALLLEQWCPLPLWLPNQDGT